jgi:hypothetical protein
MPASVDTPPSLEHEPPHRDLPAHGVGSAPPAQATVQVPPLALQSTEQSAVQLTWHVPPPLGAHVTVEPAPTVSEQEAPCRQLTSAAPPTVPVQVALAKHTTVDAPVRSKVQMLAGLHSSVERPGVAKSQVAPRHSKEH